MTQELIRVGQELFHPSKQRSMTESRHLLNPPKTRRIAPIFLYLSRHFVYMRFLSIPNLRSSIEHYGIERALDKFGQHSSMMCNMIEGTA